MDDRTAREAAWDAAIAANGDEGWVSRATVDAAIDAYLAAMKGDGAVVERMQVAIGEALERVGYFVAAYNGHISVMRQAREEAARAALSAMWNAAPNPPPPASAKGGESG